MKYIVMLGDGMADYPLEALDGQTPLEAAHKPHMDFLAQHGAVGMARTIPEGMPPGSDAANMSVLGYPPAAIHQIGIAIAANSGPSAVGVAFHEK